MMNVSTFRIYPEVRPSRQDKPHQEKLAHNIVPCWGLTGARPDFIDKDGYILILEPKGL
jgi:hypothetical protein